MPAQRSIALVWLLVTVVATSAEEPPLRALQAVYATRPQGYPDGSARPDTSVPFRWHAYHEGWPRHENARMTLHAEPYNPLESEGAVADKSVRVAFVAQHASAGKNALQADFPAAAIQAGTARVQIQCVASPILDSFRKARLAAYWSHYRCLKADVFNSGKDDVRVRVAGVPLVLRPGANVVAVKTADAAGERGDYPAWFNAVPVEVRGPARDVTLFIDHLRMEQEVPALLRERGRLFQFPVKGGDGDAALLLWPGFTPIEKDTLYTAERGHGWTQPATKRTYGGLSFRSDENGLIWCRCRDADCPLRFDVPNGRYGVWLLAAPVHSSAWDKGLSAIVNGQSQLLLPARTPAEVRRLALAGEDWDYRPGCCLWSELVRDTYFPKLNLLEADVKEGKLLLELPAALALRAVILFPDADRDEALRELGRLEFLLAESWDVAHPWVKGPFAETARYIGYHEESSHPETIPARLEALKLTAADFRRGFFLFERGLTDAVYPDTIPTPTEKSFASIAGLAAPGEAECLTIGVLPLAERHGLKLEVSDLVEAGGGKLPAAAIDVRLARYHHKCMEYGHHNHSYNFQEHYLVKRAHLDLCPGCARRIYVDITVPADAKAGVYKGTLRLGDGDTQAAANLELTVLPAGLQTPAVYFGIDNGHEVAHLGKYGINLIGGDHDLASKHGFKGYAIWPYNAAPPSFMGKRLGWSGFLQEKELMAKLIAAGQAGSGPRGFFGGYVKGRKADRPFLEALVKELPGIDITGVTTQVYAFHGADYTHSGEPWNVQVPTRGKPELLEQAARSGKEFWFVDWMRHSKEQPARFTFGFWLWRSGAKGRFSTFTYGTDYHYGTAKESYAWEPYYTLLGVVGGNSCRAMKDALAEGRSNPARDLLLIREGIDDYRYVYTVEQLARAKKLPADRQAAADKLLDELRGELSLDLARYYESRSASYAENWYPRADNPWTHRKFQDTRRRLAALLQ